MGIQSDVALAIKQELLNKLSDATKKNIINWFGNDEDTTKPEDVAKDKKDGWLLFFASYIKWSTLDEDIKLLHEELEKNDVEDAEGCGSYRIIEACHDYPESDDGTAGTGLNNPWRICKNLSVCVGSSDGDLS
jgi:hypothetical protein